MDRDTRIQRQRKILSTQTTMELHVILNKYCGRDSVLLCEKKYGLRFDKQIVEEEIMNRILLCDDVNQQE